jgi:hypothetical protein
MARPQLVGATAAAMLPAALSAAVLVSAPFAGTTTAPLADTTRAPAAHVPAKGAPPAAQSERVDHGFTFSISKGSAATLVAGEMLLVGVGAGVIVMARRRHFAED